MPEKRTGVFSIIMGVFKSKKEICEDIVAEAENVISNYIYCRRKELTAGKKKKNRLLKFLSLAAFAGVIYLIHRY